MALDGRRIHRRDGKIALVILNRSNSAVNNAVIQAPQNVTRAQQHALIVVPPGWERHLSVPHSTAIFSEDRRY
ncbi:hypothetical protein ACFY1S_27620 [Micromonospora sp. NPDC000663]|uniref:hypothetical protein n=1 Tax=Micromonospora sp. NPDC000663 TaxID=3364218 RepID=UPI0036C37011